MRSEIGSCGVGVGVEMGVGAEVGVGVAIGVAIGAGSAIRRAWPGGPRRSAQLVLAMAMALLLLAVVAGPTHAENAAPTGTSAQGAVAASPAAAAPSAPAASDPARFEKLESVQAFDALMATLVEMRQMILTDATSDREASEGMRFLLRTVAMAQDVSGDGYPQAPHFARMDTPRRKIGGDNPDAEYDNFAWDGAYAYRITGDRGTLDHLSFTVLLREANGRSRAIGYVNERDLEATPDGRFTLWLTAKKPKQPGVWIKTEPGYGSVLVRQYFGDRKKEEAATYQIEVVGRKPLDPLAPSTDAEVAHGIRMTHSALNGLGRLHHYVTPRLGESPNQFRLMNSDDFGADISSIDNLYVIGTYEIEENEALVVEVERLDVRYWNFAIENPWHESVDYAQRKTSRTHDDVQVDPDGKVRFVIAHARTDHPNYLETAGHRRGFMTFRWVGERDTKAPLPKVTKIEVSKAAEEARRAGRRR